MHQHTHRVRRTLRATLAGVLAAAVVAGTAGVAAAETVRVHDQVGDGVRQAGDPQQSRFADIQRFRADHKYRKIRFRLYNSRGGHFGDFTDVWVDTKPTNPGPERLITYSVETERFYVRKVDRFFDTNKPESGGAGRQTCSNHGDFQPRVIDMGIPRACFGFPTRVRVSVQTANEGFEVRRDWAPGYHRFSRWAGRA